jgi:ABC-type multidrug transport system ATPase subunit
MQQRLNIALALLPNPDLLLLDEAAAGLDLDARNALHSILNTFMSGGERSVIMVSHYKEEMLGICHKALNMETGLIIDV